MKNIIKLSILFFAPLIAFGMDKEIPTATEESTCIFLPGDVFKHIFRFLPITELQVYLINKQWLTCAQEDDTFKNYANLCETYGKNKVICEKKMPSLEEAVDMVHELRTLFAALPASNAEKAQLAENFENKYSLPVMLFRPSKGQGKVSLAQAQKLQKAVQDHFLILAMMRIHREQICPREDYIEYDGDDPEQFTIYFSIHPVLEIIAPGDELIASFRNNNDDSKMAYAKALCDRGFYSPVLIEVQSSDHRAKKDLARILFERGQNLTGDSCILLAQNFATDRPTACAWYKKALAQGLDNGDIGFKDLTLGGYALLRNQDYWEAAQYFEKSLEKLPQETRLKAAFFVAGGNAYSFCKDAPKSASWYKRAIATDIENIAPPDLAQAGLAFLANKDYANSVQCYEKALEKKPQGWTPAFFLGLGKAYERMNNVAQAAHYFKKWIDMMMQRHDEHQGRVNYPLIKDVLVKDRAPKKYVDWVGARINKSQQPVSNEALNNQ